MQINNNINLICHACIILDQSGVCHLAGFHFHLHYFQLSGPRLHPRLTFGHIDGLYITYLVNKLDSVTRDVQLYNVFRFQCYEHVSVHVFVDTINILAIIFMCAQLPYINKVPECSSGYLYRSNFTFLTLFFFFFSYCYYQFECICFCVYVKYFSNQQ